jgi:hypothetical protein
MCAECIGKLVEWKRLSRSACGNNIRNCSKCYAMIERKTTGRAVNAEHLLCLSER